MLHVEEPYKKMLFVIAKPYAQYDIRAYGSRVKGTQRTFSDLDLCVMKSMSSMEYNALIEALEESDLPIFVSVVEWSKLSESFKQLIEHDLLPLEQW